MHNGKGYQEGGNKPLRCNIQMYVFTGVHPSLITSMAKTNEVVCISFAPLRPVHWLAYMRVLITTKAELGVNGPTQSQDG